jgi:hypothetical protein
MMDWERREGHSPKRIAQRSALFAGCPTCFMRLARLPRDVPEKPADFPFGFCNRPPRASNLCSLQP